MASVANSKEASNQAVKTQAVETTDAYPKVRI